jgi:hypothetical protein
LPVHDPEHTHDLLTFAFNFSPGRLGLHRPSQIWDDQRRTAEEELARLKRLESRTAETSISYQKKIKFLADLLGLKWQTERLVNRFRGNIDYGLSEYYKLYDHHLHFLAWEKIHSEESQRLWKLRGRRTEDPSGQSHSGPDVAEAEEKVSKAKEMRDFFRMDIVFEQLSEVTLIPETKEVEMQLAGDKNVSGSGSLGDIISVDFQSHDSNSVSMKREDVDKENGVSMILHEDCSETVNTTIDDVSIAIEARNQWQEETKQRVEKEVYQQTKWIREKTSDYHRDFSLLKYILEADQKTQRLLEFFAMAQRQLAELSELESSHKRHQLQFEDVKSQVIKQQSLVDQLRTRATTRSSINTGLCVATGISNEQRDWELKYGDSHKKAHTKLDAFFGALLEICSSRWLPQEALGEPASEQDQLFSSSAKSGRSEVDELSSDSARWRGLNESQLEKANEGGQIMIESSAKQAAVRLMKFLEESVNADIPDPPELTRNQIYWEKLRR